MPSHKSVPSSIQNKEASGECSVKNKRWRLFSSETHTSVNNLLPKKTPVLLVPVFTIGPGFAVFPVSVLGSNPTR